MKRDEIIAKIEALAQEIAAPRNIEIVEVELKGAGKNQLLRIYIDKPEGVTHTDCEFVSRAISAAIDEDDPFPGAWELEVSSPGVERKLSKPADWTRFTGKTVTVVLTGPPPELRPEAPPGMPLVANHFDGVIAEAADDMVRVDLPDGRRVGFPLAIVERANLKFEW